MNELEQLLNNIPGSYYDFITAILHYAKKKPERLEKVLEYIKGNPGVTSSDVIYFVSTQPDFYDDSVPQKAVDKAV